MRRPEKGEARGQFERGLEDIAPVTPHCRVVKGLFEECYARGLAHPRDRGARRDRGRRSDSHELAGAGTGKDRIVASEQVIEGARISSSDRGVESP